jgi:hypothetical protein
VHHRRDQQHDRVIDGLHDRDQALSAARASRSEPLHGIPARLRGISVRE